MPAETILQSKPPNLDDPEVPNTSPYLGKRQSMMQMLPSNRLPRQRGDGLKQCIHNHRMNLQKIMHMFSLEKEPKVRDMLEREEKSSKKVTDAHACHHHSVFKQGSSLKVDIVPSSPDPLPRPPGRSTLHIMPPPKHVPPHRPS